MIRKRSIVEKLLMGMLGLGILAAWAAANVQTLGIGQPAPDFNLHGVIVDQNGPKVRPFALQDFALSDVMVVAFMANHCPVATAYEDRLIQLAKDYQNRGVAVVAISPNEPRPLKANEPVGDRGDTLGEMAVRAVKKGFPFPYLYDGDAQEVSRAFGPVATPHIFIFDKQRKLRYSGRIDDSQDPAKVATREARDAIEALLAGKTVPVATTKAFGCSIKWRQGKENAAARDAANVAGSTPEAILTAANANPGAVTPIDAAGISALVANRDGAAPRLINVWATWCGPCREEMPDLAAISKAFGPRGLDVVTISADQAAARERAQAFLEQQGVRGRHFIFSGSDMSGLIEAVDKEWQGAIPYTMLVARGGKVLYRNMGKFDPKGLAQTIEGTLPAPQAR